MDVLDATGARAVDARVSTMATWSVRAASPPAWTSRSTSWSASLARASPWPSSSFTRPMRLNLRFDVAVDGDQMTGTSKAGRLPTSKVSGVRTS